MPRIHDFRWCPVNYRPIEVIVDDAMSELDFSEMLSFSLRSHIEEVVADAAGDAFERLIEKLSK